MSQLQDTVTDTQIGHTIHRQGDRVWLEGVPHEEMVYSWDCSLRGLHVLLIDRGVAITLDELMALSGDAFFICFAQDSNTFPELVMPTDPMKNAADALGYESQWLITDCKHRAHLDKSEPDIEKRRAMTQEIVDRIIEQVDAGRPPLVAGVSQMGCGNWSLITGYDRENQQFCHNGLHAHPAMTWHNIRGLSYKLNDEDGEFGYWNGRPRGTVLPGFAGGWLVNPVFILGDQTSTPNEHEVALTVLRRALDLYHAKPIHFFGGMHYFGKEAYQQWIDAITTMPNPQDLVLDQVVRGRIAAATYCRKIMPLFPNDKQALEQAADSYEKLVAIANDAFADLIPFDWDNPKRAAWGGNNQRQQQAEALKQMLALEQTAIEAIRSIVLKANVQRDADKVWIKGVEGFSVCQWVDSVHGSQARILQAMQDSMCYDDLICYSGFAFRVGIHEAMCPSAGHPCCGYMCIENGNKALPWETTFYDSMPWSKPKDDRQAFESQVCGDIKASIDRGIPVHYGSEEDGLIIGYAEDGKRWWCVHPYYMQGKVAFWHDEVPTEGMSSFAGPNWPWGVAVWKSPKALSDQLTSKQLTINALKQALDMWQNKVDPNMPDRPKHFYYTGDQAYDNWINWLEAVQAGKVDDPKSGMQGNGWCMDVLVHSRRVAAKWLRRQAQRFDSPVAEQFNIAAKQYEQLVTTCLQDFPSTWELTLSPQHFDKWTPQLRSTQITRLKQARELDRKAIDALQAALQSMEIKDAM